jgi:hypothetical protein
VRRSRYGAGGYVIGKLVGKGFPCELWGHPGNAAQFHKCHDPLRMLTFRKNKRELSEKKRASLKNKQKPSLEKVRPFLIGNTALTT